MHITIHTDYGDLTVIGELATLERMDFELGGLHNCPATYDEGLDRFPLLRILWFGLPTCDAMSYEDYLNSEDNKNV